MCTRSQLSSTVPKFRILLRSPPSFSRTKTSQSPRVGGGRIVFDHEFCRIDTGAVSMID
ncbi:hypothetical protein M413DRAFT_448357 [Hebeloma cylindrosporum]|uniref:Uncharacterized protein n=1 Tax=Hebeloma cylindrosporum TaxID=76867 RepID=A0A0C3BZS5_HEBCY|nr:hypothetical protein M413DRAFT_448357 [Hebeloma cylindrosporum h7]